MTAATLAREPLVLVVLALVAGLLAPSEELADHSDLILAALVLAVSLTIDPGRLIAAARAWRPIVLLSLLPFAMLFPLALALGRLFDGPEREGLIALGLAPTEVATAGLVALAGAGTELALAVIALSLVASALLAPLLAPLVAEASPDSGELLVRFGLVVLVPLAVGLAVRASRRAGSAVALADPAATVVLALLVYAALGDLGSRSSLGGAVLAGTLFLAASAAVALLLHRALGGGLTGPFVFSLRDFAVAAALAGELAAPGAAATPAVYGALMLVLAAGVAAVLRRRGQTPDRQPGAPA
jgi:predicted Na+-dependent transporter